MSTVSTEHPNLQTNKTKDDPSQAHEVLFREQFEALEIPPNIDPRLLALWLQRERAAIEGKTTKKQRPLSQGRKLSRLFAAFVGVVVMCLVIVLGLINGQEANTILSSCCQAFLIYAVIGFAVGCILEHCINDSVETLLREIVRRTDETMAFAQENATQTSSAGTTSDHS